MVEKKNVDDEKDVEEETKEEKPIVLRQTPTDYELVYETPDGILREKEYLVWLGNTLVEIKQSLVG